MKSTNHTTKRIAYQHHNVRLKSDQGICFLVVHLFDYNQQYLVKRLLFISIKFVHKLQTLTPQLVFLSETNCKFI